MKLLLEAYLPEDGRVHKTFVIDLASILTAIAARWCKPSAGDLKTLQGYRRKLKRHRRLGLSPKRTSLSCGQ